MKSCTKGGLEMNAFEYYINSPSFNNQKENLVKALEEREVNPVSSITKSFYVVNDLVNKLLKDNGVTPGSKIVDNIKFLSEESIIPESINENLFYIRRIRNKFAAHPNEIDGKQVIADPITTTYYLKHVYEFLEWYFKQYLGEKISFDNFDTIITTVTEVETEKEKQSNNILIFELPKFYIDNEYFANNNIKKSSINELDTKELLEVYRLFFTTNLPITAIEEKIFSSTKNRGIVVYYLVNSYMDSGVTYSWRNYVLKFGMLKTITNIEEMIETLSEEKSRQYRNLISVLRSIM